MSTSMMIHQEQSTPAFQQHMLPAGTTDDILITMWLSKGKTSANTQDAYKRDIRMFLTFLDCKPLQQVTLADVQSYAGRLNGKSTTRNRRLAVVKSLLTFGAKTGYLVYNVGSLVELEDVPTGLAQRILPEAQVTHMILSEPNIRNRVMLHLLYHCGLRVSELINLEWADLSAREDGKAQLVVIGKGNKERHILMEPPMYQELLTLKTERPEIFTSRSHRRVGTRKLRRAQVGTIVRNAARRVSIEVNFSPHWLRHACASHALQHGASIGLVKDVLGHESLATTSKYIHVRPTDSLGKFLPM